MANHETRYKNPPVPRRLVGQGQVPPGLSSTDTKPSHTLQGPGMASKSGKIRTGTKTNFQFRRLPVRLERGQSQTHPRTLAEPTGQDMGDINLCSVPGQEIYDPDRLTDCHRKAGSYGQITHDAHTVAPQKQLENTGNFREEHPHSKITPPTSEMVAGGGKCSHTSTLTPSSTCSANLYRHIKRRVSLRRTYSTYTDNTTVVAYINKEGGMKSGPLCALLWRILNWCARNQVTLKA